MFNLFKKNKAKDIALVAPVSGKVVAITEVPDPVFAQKMMGEGVAIQLTDETIVAPCDGTITLIPDTKHAFGMTNEHDMELLVHIGLETVGLAGEGFTVLVNQGDKVTKGTPIIKINKAFIEGQGINLITPLVVLNHQNYEFKEFKANMDVIAGQSEVITYLPKAN